MSWKLWLDDQLDTVRPMPNKLPWWKFWIEYNWIGATSSIEAMEFVTKFGPPSYISFDFDLGGYDTAEVFIKWLAEHYYEANIEYDIHSKNVAGQKIIKSLMDSWKKSKEL